MNAAKMLNFEPLGKIYLNKVSYLNFTLNSFYFISK